MHCIYELPVKYGFTSIQFIRSDFSAFTKHMNNTKRLIVMISECKKEKGKLCFVFCCFVIFNACWELSCRLSCPFCQRNKDLMKADKENISWGVHQHYLTISLYKICTQCAPASSSFFLLIFFFLRWFQSVKKQNIYIHIYTKFSNDNNNKKKRL